MEYKKWLTYWKKSLSDSLKADIDIEKLPHFEVFNFKMETRIISNVEEVNKLIDIEENRINKKKGIANKDSKNWEQITEVQIVISPIKIKPTAENLVFLKDKKPKLPFWYFAKLDRNGRLEIPEETFPIFQRKYLEPLADEKTEFVFGSLENIDKATAIGKEEYKDFSDYTNYLKDVFKLAINQEIDSYSIQGYEPIHNAIILLPDEEINAAIGIIQLYEKILNEKAVPELIKTFITLDNRNQNTPLDIPDLIQSNPLHLGQMGFDFPLSISQRKSLNTYLQANDKVFAINGPPGTGKTTLLQSIVANKIVESAIVGANAPIILACSTNNQAVTNIIDSFSKSNTKAGKLQGRWLPEIEGYATYLPANGKTDAELNGMNYKKQNGEGIFNRIENHDFLQKAKTFFIEKSTTYFGTSVLSIEEATKKLQKEIAEIKTILKDASAKWNDYLHIEKIFLTDYVSTNIISEKHYEDDMLNEALFKTDIMSLHSLEQRIINYFNHEPFFRKLLCFFGLKSSLNNRATELKIILRDSLIDTSNEFVFTKNFILEKLDYKVKTAKNIIEKIERWKTWKRTNSINGNPPKTDEEYRELELLKVRKNIKPNCFYDELDVSLRHKAFQLALHFWEGKYLIQLESDLADPNFDRRGWKQQKADGKGKPC